MQADNAITDADASMRSPEQVFYDKSLAPPSQTGARFNGKSGAMPPPSQNLYEGSVRLGLDDELDPISHAHLLVPRRSRINDIPFPIVCIAPPDEIYELLASAVFQRRLLGVDQPVLGFTFDPMKCYLQIVVAWLAPHHTDDHDCVSASPWSIVLELSC